MKIPNWFKIVWWIILLAITSLLLFNRIESIKLGTCSPFDIFLFLIWVALMLTPIFNEMELWGIKFKREIEDLKAKMDIKFGEIKNEIKINQNQRFTANIYGPPPSDERIKELEERMDKIDSGGSISKEEESKISVPDANIDMFKVRFQIEREINRIWDGRYQIEDDPYTPRRLPLYKQLQELSRFDIIDQNLLGLLRDMLAICNNGIHGEKITRNQMEFINNFSPKVIKHLKKIK